MAQPRGYRRAFLPFLVALAMGQCTPPASAPSTPAPPPAREAGLRRVLDSIPVPPLQFTPPEPLEDSIQGVPVVFLEDRSLPLVSVFALFEGGYSRLDRSRYAAATALPSLLRTGGTRDLDPDSVDVLVESLALQLTFGQSGTRASASVNTLRDNLEPAVALWRDLLRSPRFDPAEIEVWRGRQLESVRRRRDDPGLLAVSEFNRLMYGDHPIGWELDLVDLDPERLTPAVLDRVHRAVICPDNMILGVTGDLSWSEASTLLNDVLDGWPACSGELSAEPPPRVRSEGGVFIIPRALGQSTVVLGQPSELRMSDRPEYFAALVGNAVLGSNGFSSRLMSRVRTEMGYAYGVSSLWTLPRDHTGILGAITQTRPETTVEAAELILATLEEMGQIPPLPDEVTTVVDQIVNGFVFSFETPSQILVRRMSYLAQDLPRDWLDRYVAGVQAVEPPRIRDVFRETVRPDRITILIVGDPEAIDGLDRLGPATVLEVPAVGAIPDGGASDPGEPPGGAPVSAGPRGSPRSPG